MNMIGRPISSLPFKYENINYIKIENGIYDDLYVTGVDESLKEVNNFIVPSEWDRETYLHAKFDGNLFSGNADFGVENTTNIILKRREKGTYKWFPIFNIDVDSSDDFNFVIVDPYATSGVTYEYAVVPIINGLEGEYSIAEIKVHFDDLVIIDKDGVYSTPFDIEISQQKNNTSSVIMPISAKYPLYIANASNDYFTGNISATFFKEQSDNETDTENYEGTTKFRDKVLDFLNNRKIKYIKDPFGRCWIAAIGSTISDENQGHNCKHSISFDFTEVGNCESNEDMSKYGFLDIGEEWWV